MNCSVGPSTSARHLSIGLQAVHSGLRMDFLENGLEKGKLLQLNEGLRTLVQQFADLLKKQGEIRVTVREVECQLVRITGVSELRSRHADYSPHVGGRGARAPPRRVLRGPRRSLPTRRRGGAAATATSAPKHSRSAMGAPSRAGPSSGPSAPRCSVVSAGWRCVRPGGSTRTAIRFRSVGITRERPDEAGLGSIRLGGSSDEGPGRPAPSPQGVHRQHHELLADDRELLRELRVDGR